MGTTRAEHVCLMFPLREPAPLFFGIERAMMVLLFVRQLRMKQTARPAKTASTVYADVRRRVLALITTCRAATAPQLLWS
jgi:hypothetical protein